MYDTCPSVGNYSCTKEKGITFLLTLVYCRVFFTPGAIIIYIVIYEQKINLQPSRTMTIFPWVSNLVRRRRDEGDRGVEQQIQALPRAAAHTRIKPLYDKNNRNKIKERKNSK